MVKKEKESFEIVDVTIETEPKIRDNETDETYTCTEATCRILNELKELREAIG